MIDRASKAAPRPTPMAMIRMTGAQSSFPDQTESDLAETGRAVARSARDRSQYRRDRSGPADAESKHRSTTAMLACHRPSTSIITLWAGWWKMTAMEKLIPSTVYVRKPTPETRHWRDAGSLQLGRNNITHLLQVNEGTTIAARAARPCYDDRPCMRSCLSRCPDCSRASLLLPEGRITDRLPNHTFSDSGRFLDVARCRELVK